MAEARVERHEIVEDDGAPGRQRTGHREPGDDAERDRGDAQREGGKRCGDGPQPPRRDGDHDAERRRQHERMRLDRQGGAERQAAPGQRASPSRFHPADDAQGAGDEERTQQEVALPGLPGPAGQMVEHEQQRDGQRRGAPPRRHEGGGRERQRSQPGQIEHAPGQISGAQHAHHEQVQQVHAGKVHVEHVPIRHRPLRDPPRHVMHQRRIMRQRPRHRPSHKPQNKPRRGAARRPRHHRDDEPRSSAGFAGTIRPGGDRRERAARRATTVGGGRSPSRASVSVQSTPR